MPRQWPNHALQRTAPRVTARAFCERSSSYIWASVVRATVGHAPRHAPQSLSLGTLAKQNYGTNTTNTINSGIYTTHCIYTTFF